MSKFAIFSHKPDGYARGTGENFRLDVTGGEALAEEVIAYLRSEGHKVVECLEYKEESGGQRHYIDKGAKHAEGC